ncbi:serine/threonine-protein phosphatase, partial [Actinotalea ferrariae]|nr:serine/threonine-protein phosphatase [Actinotalea ferrariae]
AAEHAARARDEQAEAAPEPEPEEDDEPPRRRRALGVVVLLLVLALVGVGGWLGYRWTQDQYYVGDADGRVAVFRGIPQSVGPLELSRVVERTDTRVEDLPGFIQDRLVQTVPATSLAGAREFAESLDAEADSSP